MSRPGAGPAEVRPDDTLARVGPRVWVGGAPLRLFRLTDVGDEVVAEFVRRRSSAGLRRESSAVEELLDRLVLAGAAHPVPRNHTGAPAASDVTVVVPVRDRVGHLEGVLDSLGTDHAAVVVVDDGSLDPDSVAAVVEAHGALLVRHGSPLGPAAARNAGLAEVRTAVVAFVDSDVTCGDGWLDPLLAQLGDERVALVAPRVRSASGDGLLADYESSHSPLDLGVDPALVHPRSRVSYLPAATLVGRVDVLNDLDGFDEALRFGEDVDLVWRAVEAGHLVRYEPAAVVHHEPRVEWAGWVAQRFAYGSSAAELDRRHPRSVAPVACSGWSAAAWGLAASGSPVLGATVGVGSAAALARKLPDLPPAEAAMLALRGHLGAGRQLAKAAIRPWWPALAVGAAVSRRGRRVATTVLVSRLIAGEDPVAHRFVSLADDVAYGTGVWWGAWRARRPGALLPAFPNWPPSSPI